MNTDERRCGMTFFAIATFVATNCASSQAADVQYQLANIPFFLEAPEENPNGFETGRSTPIRSSRIKVPEGRMPIALDFGFKIKVKPMCDPTYLILKNATLAPVNDPSTYFVPKLCAGTRKTSVSICVHPWQIS